MSSELKILFAGGGTGGHVFPAINMAKALLKSLNAKILFIGASAGIEKNKVPQAGFEIKLIPVVGFQRKLTFKNFLFPYKLYKSMRICKKEMLIFKPNIVIGTGGYVTGPVLKTAVKLGIPTVLQEQNSYPGITSRLLANRVDLLLLAYEEASKYLDKAKKIVVCGNPLMVDIKKEDKKTATEYFNLNPQKKTILILGGSQGAASLNKSIVRLIKENQIPDTHQFLWQTGKNNYNKYKNEFKQIKIFPFIDEMHKAYNCADFAICRAGAMTLSELTAYGLPAILVPYPHAAADHQYKNALTIEKKGGAVVIKDDEKTYTNLLKPLKNFMEDQEYLKEKTREISAQDHGDAMPVIIDEIRQLAEENKVNKNE